MSFATRRPATARATKTTSDTTPTSSSGSITKRLQQELMTLMMSKTPGISAFPDSDGNLFNWTATVKGSDATVYQDQVYKLSIQFPQDYPYKAPTVTFITPIFHPNVDQYGNICLDILKDKWSAVYNVRTVLISIQSLLSDPNNDSPLNVQAANLWANQEEYARVVQQKYAEASQANKVL